MTSKLPKNKGNAIKIINDRRDSFKKFLNNHIHDNHYMDLDLEVFREKDDLIPSLNNFILGEEIQSHKSVNYDWCFTHFSSIIEDKKNYVLVNPSGMGKTSFLYFLGLKLLEDTNSYNFYPIYITCQQINVANKYKSIPEIISELIEKLYQNSETLFINKDWSNLCLLLDGLDQSTDIDSIVLSIENKEFNYQKSKIIITSRENASFKVPNYFEKIRLELPNKSEIEKYLGENNYKKLKKLVEKSNELIRIPILLEMLKMITEHGMLPEIENRSHLYGQFIKILTRKELEKTRFWNNKYDIKNFLENELENCLEKIAFDSLSNNRILEISSEDLSNSLQDNEKKEALMNTGIILEIFEFIDKRIIFRHQSFQSYFAAQYIRKNTPELFYKIMDKVQFFYDDAWREVIKLYIGQENDNNKIEYLINSLCSTEDDELKTRFLYLFECLLETDFSKKYKEKIWELFFTQFEENSFLFDRFVTNYFKYFKNDSTKKLILKHAKKILEKHTFPNILCSSINIFIQMDAYEYINLIIPFLTHNNKHVRNITVLAIECFGDETHVNILINMLKKEKETLVQDSLIIALSYLIADFQIEKLFLLLIHNNRFVSSAAEIAISSKVTTKHYKLIKPLLRHPKKHIRINATVILSNLGIEFIQDIYKSEDDEIKAVLLEYFEDTINFPSMTKYENDYILNRILDNLFYLKKRKLQNNSIIKEAITFFKEIKKELNKSSIIEKLIPALKSNNFMIVSGVILCIGQYGLPEHVKLIVPFLNSNIISIKKEAIYVIASSGESQYLEHILPLLKSRSEKIRNDVLRGISDFGDSSYLKFIVPIINKSNYFSGYNYRRICRLCSENHIDYLRSFLTHSFKPLQLNAIQRIGQVGSLVDIELFKPYLFCSDYYTKQMIIQAISNIYKRYYKSTDLTDLLAIKIVNNINPSEIVVINSKKLEFILKNLSINLTMQEFNFMVKLARNVGNVVSYQDLTGFKDNDIFNNSASNSARQYKTKILNKIKQAFKDAGRIKEYEQDYKEVNSFIRSKPKTGCMLVLDPEQVKIIN